MKEVNSNTKFDFNNPIPANEIEVLDFKDTGTKKLTRFKYADGYYTQIYNYGKGYGFKFIEKYKSAEHQQKALSQQGEMIYSSTLESNCTPFGVYLEYSLMKNGSLNNLPAENPSLTPIEGESKYENYPHLFEEGEGKSVGHTVGELEIANSGKSFEANGGYETAISANHTCLGFIWGETKEQSKANALRIVTCVNGWDKLNAQVKLWQDAHNTECTVTSLYKDENDKLKANNDALVSALKDATERMERARGILKRDGNSNWGMLDTTELKELLNSIK